MQVHRLQGTGFYRYSLKFYVGFRWQGKGEPFPYFVILWTLYFKRPCFLKMISQSVAILSMASLAVPLPSTIY